MGQSTLCNRFHNARERMARWLLMCHDRVDGDVMNLTQEFMAIMLGTSRVTVTLNAQQLMEEGTIRYHRGRMTILDRPAMEATACECYAIVRREYDR